MRAGAPLHAPTLQAGPLTLFRQSFLLQGANPKSVLYFCTLLPVFAGDAEGAPLRIAVLGSMARNVEIKAAVKDFTRITAALAALAAAAPTRLVQEDTFFRSPRGRLKLRKLTATSGELIYYERPDGTAPRESNYVLVPTAEPDRLRDVLAAAYGIIGVVRKRRTVRMVDRTRVHLDEVAGLGTFVELEVVLGDGEPAESGVVEARRLMAALGIQEDQLVSRAYIDLLQSKEVPGMISSG